MKRRADDLRNTAAEIIAALESVADDRHGTVETGECRHLRELAETIRRRRLVRQ